MLSTLHEGFVDHAVRACFFTDHQIFDRFHKYTLKGERARSGKLALSLKELQSIEPGDFIVHVDHGVGRFGGLLRTQVNGSTQEMIKLVYKNNDCIFVSSTRSTNSPNTAVKRGLSRPSTNSVPVHGTA